MMKFRKAIACAVGLLAAFGSHYGLDISEAQEAALIDVILMGMTVAGVWAVPNAPAA